MFKRVTDRLINKYGLLQIINAAMATVTLILAVMLVLTLVMPVKVSYIEPDIATPKSVTEKHALSSVLQSEPPAAVGLAKVMRKGLFKPSTPLLDKPMADKTIERIKSQLKLQCIMEMNKETVAYINIKGMGLRKCKVGDSVHDLFTVVSINKNSVGITIVGHNVTLSL